MRSIGSAGRAIELSVGTNPAKLASRQGRRGKQHIIMMDCDIGFSYACVSGARADSLVARKTAPAGALVRISKEPRLLLSSLVVRPQRGRTPEARLLHTHSLVRMRKLWTFLCNRRAKNFGIAAEVFEEGAPLTAGKDRPRQNPSVCSGKCRCSFIRRFSPWQGVSSQMIPAPRRRLVQISKAVDPRP